ncbi:MAG TPA: helix-turn-helix domain-containing protein [Ktedonobacterales bacterium]|nr:helix-turn-helix domain-containing protein [Ktedonobacterales bacterium]
MATKDGNKRRTTGAPSKASAPRQETPQRRGAATKRAPTARDTKPPRATGESAKAPTGRSRPGRTRAATAPTTPLTLPVEATAEAELPVSRATVATEVELPVTQAAVATHEPFDDMPLGEEAGEETPQIAEPPAGLPEALGADVGEAPPDLLDETRVDEEVSGARFEPAPSSSGSQPRWMRRERMPHGNALGILIERQFSAPGSPCRSYSDLERRSGISREALSRYVTTRPDRRRSPTIDTLVAIADAMHLSLDATCRAAAATAKGTVLATPEAQRDRDAIVSALIGGLSDDQFSAVVELLRQMRPAGAV